jgi:hypothetical protein
MTISLVVKRWTAKKRGVNMEICQLQQKIILAMLDHPPKGWDDHLRGPDYLPPPEGWPPSDRGPDGWLVSLHDGKRGTNPQS